MANSWKIFALIATVILIASPLSALPPASVTGTSGAISVAAAYNQPLQAAFVIVPFRTHATTIPPEVGQPLPDDAGAAAPGPPPIPPELRNEGDPGSSVGRNPLLLVSLIGFALLLGGIIPGMRIRRVHTPRTAQL